MRRSLCALGLWLLPAVGATPASAHAAPPTEYEVKAVFLHNFTLFVTWDSAACAGEAFAVGVLGADPFGDLLDSAVAGTSVAGKPVRVVRSSRPQELVGCQLVFIARTGPQALGDALRLLKRPGLLTVGEQARFALQGGMIEFGTENGRVRFVINANAAREAGLEVSSRLQRVASSVLSGE